MDIRKKIEKLTLGPGVYIMKSANGEVFYIGKASSIKKRIMSHFSRSESKNSNFLGEVCDIECIECTTPEQALILEAALIKERKPKYNIALRDNKSYPYVAVSKDDFPRIFITRPKTKSPAILFGPYPAAKTLKSALESIRKVFPFRSCSRLPKTACLFFHLKLCSAPCEGKIVSREYKEIISNATKILNGERRQLTQNLKVKMKRLADKQKFEQAAKIRNIIIAIDSLYEGRPKAHETISLKETLGLAKLPLYLEAIDISSLGASEATGSVVVFKDGLPDKGSYRRFLIREVKGKDDYAMIAEVVKRRYSRLIREKKSLPDLVVIDGGRGHVGIAQKVFSSLGISIAVIGIAKKNEEVWFADRRVSLSIAKDQPCLHLLQRIRDEAHRFAHSYQLHRRKGKVFKK
ncbi:MAG: GIY-YIG nuclease family protein [Candidatus Omnitrophica bacterium]|nr:GIY-YIG nuclease family protein [Candidatus Omnitrophota bacterium]